MFESKILTKAPALSLFTIIYTFFGFLSMLKQLFLTESRDEAIFYNNRMSETETMVVSKCLKSLPLFVMKLNRNSIISDCWVFHFFLFCS